MPYQTDQHLDPAHIVIHNQDGAETAEKHHSKRTPLGKRNRPRRSVAEAELAFKKKYGKILVIDDLPSHTAIGLCQSATSAGPNFVNPDEGYYCDMELKAIHPVCSETHSPRQNSTSCFDMEQNELGKHVQLYTFPRVGARLNQALRAHLAYFGTYHRLMFVITR